MKSKSIYPALMGVAFFCLGSCSERTPDYFQPIEGVYFNNRANNNMLSDSTNVTFVYESGNQMDVPVKIRLLGRPSAQERTIDLQVTSTDAVEGTDYVLPVQTVLPANSTELDYLVTLKRTASLKTASKTINLELYANSNFSLPVSEEEQADGTKVSLVKYRIIFSDMFAAPPVAWEAELLGTFSQQKFELICKVLSVEPGDFNDTALMTLAKLQYIYNEITQYINDEISKRDQGLPFDTDVIDKATGEPLDFNS